MEVKELAVQMSRGRGPQQEAQAMQRPGAQGIAREACQCGTSRMSKEEKNRRLG